MLSQRTALTFAFLFTLLATTPAFGATITVNSGADISSPAVCSLRDAVASANTDTAVGGCTAGSGIDQIVFDEAVFKVETVIELTGGELTVAESVTIMGSELIVLSGEANARIITIAAGTTVLIDLQLTNGQAERGGLIYVADGATLEADGLMATAGEATGDAAADGGGALYIDGGSAIIDGSTFDGNSATGASGSGGSILNNGGSLIMTGSVVSNSTANRAGGGIEDAGGTTFLTDVTLSGNDAGTAPGNGGGLHTGGGAVTVEGGTVTGNTAVEGGGLWSSGTLIVRADREDNGTLIDGNESVGDDDEALEGGGGLFNQGGAMTVSGATISTNSATGSGGSGGGAFSTGDDADLIITGTTFSGNTAVRAGGGIEIDGGVLTLVDVDFHQNDAGDSPGNGGALHVTAGTVTATGGAVTDNTATEGGGFWHNAGWTMTLTDVAFEGNVASGEDADQGGGALFNNGGALDITSGSIRDNTATAGSGSGGGLLTTGGTVEIDGVVFNGNAASRAGGAIEIIDGTLEIGATNFSENDAGDSPGNGGAIHVTGEATVEVTGGVVHRNAAAREGGGFWNQAGSTMRVEDTEFTANTAAGAAADDGGGALFNNGGVLNVTGGNITGNAATGASGSGGGILNLGGMLTVTATTLENNLANRAGGAIEDVGGTVVLASVLVTGNGIDTPAPGNGGGLHSGGGTVTLRGGEFVDNEAVEGGGIWTSGTLVMEQNVADEGTTVAQNVATGDEATDGGGGIYVQAGSATIEEALITGNAATGVSGSGGAVFIADGVAATLTRVRLVENSANRAGGAVEIADDPATEARADVSLVSVEARENNAGSAPGNGGAIHSGGGTVSVESGTFSRNFAVQGGAFWVNARLDIDRGDNGPATGILANTATGDEATSGGGGIYAESGAFVEIVGAEIQLNRASGSSGSGGGIFVADSVQVNMTGGGIAGNTANRAGGGVEVADDPSTDAVALVFLTDVTVVGNRIDVAQPGNGGGVHVGGAGIAWVNRSTISENSAREGAGLWISSSGELDLVLSTVSGNASTQAGGGVYDDGGADIALSSVTVAANTAGTAGGGLLSQSSDGSTFTLENVLVGDNTGTTGPDCSGSFDSVSTNLIENAADCTVSGTPITGQDALLMDLADNGAATQTHALTEGSPAIDAGTSFFEVDQRGVAISGRGADIGAYEFGAGPTPCSVAAQLGLRNLAPGNGADESESVELVNADASLGIDLTGCTLAAFDARTEQIVYALALSERIGAEGALLATNQGGDITLGLGVFPNEFGAVVVIEGDADVGDMLTGATLANAVAGVVYRDASTVTDTFAGGADNDAERAAFDQALADLIVATSAAGPGENAPVDLSTFAAPNPAVHTATVRFGLEQSATVRVTLFDVLGREVATLADAVYERGRHAAPLNASALSAGLYLVRVDVDGEHARIAHLTILR